VKDGSTALQVAASGLQIAACLGDTPREALIPPPFDRVALVGAGHLPQQVIAVLGPLLGGVGLALFQVQPAL